MWLRSIIQYIRESYIAPSTKNNSIMQHGDNAQCIVYIKKK